MISIEQIPAPLRRIGRYAGYPAFAILVAIVSLYFSLPRDVIRDRIEMALSADPRANPPGLGMDVTIGDADLTLLFGPGVSLENIVMKTRPTVPGEKSTRFVIDDLTLRTGILGQLFRSPSYSFKTHVLSGELRGDIAIGKNLEVNVDADKLVLTGAPALVAFTKLPVDGRLSAKIDLKLEKQLAVNAAGHIDITLDDAAIGDGKAKLTVPGDPFLSAGVTVPRIRLGKVELKVPVDKGRVKFDGTKVKSGDLELYVDGYVDLRDPSGNSVLNLWLRIKPSDALVKKEPTIELMTNSMQKTADGFIGLQLTGTFDRPRGLPAKEAQPGLSGHTAVATTPTPPPRHMPGRTTAPVSGTPGSAPSGFAPRGVSIPPPPSSAAQPSMPTPTAAPPPSPNPPPPKDVEVNTPSEAPPAPPTGAPSGGPPPGEPPPSQ